MYDSTYNSLSADGKNLLALVQEYIFPNQVMHADEFPAITEEADLVSDLTEALQYNQNQRPGLRAEDAVHELLNNGHLITWEMFSGDEKIHYYACSLPGESESDFGMRTGRLMAMQDQYYRTQAEIIKREALEREVEVILRKGMEKDLKISATKAELNKLENSLIPKAQTRVDNLEKLLVNITKKMEKRVGYTKARHEIDSLPIEKMTGNNLGMLAQAEKLAKWAELETLWLKILASKEVQEAGHVLETARNHLYELLQKKLALMKELSRLEKCFGRKHRPNIHTLKSNDRVMDF